MLRTIHFDDEFHRDPRLLSCSEDATVAAVAATNDMAQAV